MSKLKSRLQDRINSMRGTELDIGFGKNNFQSKLFDDKGKTNVVKTGIPLRLRFDIFHYLLNISWKLFFLITFLAYSALNLIFALFYYQMGSTSLHGAASGKMDFFADAFFFSAQTLTTVGYGYLSPATTLASTVATIEALMGLLRLAVFTGLMYGRFSQPRSVFVYSKKMLISPFNEGKALMIRLVSPSKSELIELEATMMLMMIDPQTNQRNYIPLELERSKVSLIPLNWTLVHPIDDNSPLYNKTHAELEALDIEILVMVKAFDETRAQTIFSRNSYKHNELVWNAKFEKMNTTQGSNEKIIFDVSNVSSYIKI